MAATPSAQYTLTMRVEIDQRPEMLGKVASAIEGGGSPINHEDDHTDSDPAVTHGTSSVNERVLS